MYYKDIFLTVSNGLTKRRISYTPNKYAESDIRMLGGCCSVRGPMAALNGKKYYYFFNNMLDADVIQYVLRCNGVYGERHYSKYVVRGSDREEIVRVPLDFVHEHKEARAFLDKLVMEGKKNSHVSRNEILNYLEEIYARQHQK